MIDEHVRRYPMSIGVLVVMLVVYVVQVVFAGSLSSGAAYTVATSIPQEVYLLLTPWLHSSHQHLIGNAIVFAFLGGWTERRVSPESFARVVLWTGYLTNLGPAIAGFGGPGLGASGITNALWANFMLVHFAEYQRTIQMDTIEIRRIARHVGLAMLGLVFVLKSVAEYVGYIEPAPGTATGSHLLGVGIGLAWFTYRWLR